MPDLSLPDLAGLWALLWPAMTITMLGLGDVSLNVFRVVFVVQQRRLLAALVAGAEASVWLAAAGIVFADMTLVRVAGFILGVAAGTAMGVAVAGKLRLGMTTVRIYVDATRDDRDGRPLDLGAQIAREIHASGHGATVFRGIGCNGPVDMVLSTVRRRDADNVLTIARGVDPGTFAAIDSSLHPASALVGSTAGRV